MIRQFQGPAGSLEALFDGASHLFEGRVREVGEAIRDTFGVHERAKEHA